MPTQETKAAVVITGGSAGIGEATAHAFARLGHPLVLGARREGRLQAVAEECKRLGAPRAHALPLDVSDAASITKFCGEALSREPGFETLVNNAGMARGRDAVAVLKDEDIREMLDINVLGVLRVTRRLLPSLIERQRGHVINLGSLAAHGVYEGGSVYCGAKHFVRAVSQTLRLELSGTNVRVTEVAPGMVETEFSEVRLGDPAKAKAVYAGMKPLVAADVADCIVWAATRPAHVNIVEIVLTPTAQASLSKVARST